MHNLLILYGYELKKLLQKKLLLRLTSRLKTINIKKPVSADTGFLFGSFRPQSTYICVLTKNKPKSYPLLCTFPSCLLNKYTVK